MMQTENADAETISRLQQPSGTHALLTTYCGPAPATDAELPIHIV